jgi:capsular polysaccharide biosynthesis protein
VPAKLSGFQIEALRLLGIQDSQLCPFLPSEAWDCESLFFASPAAISGFTSPPADRWLRERILNACNISPSPKGRRIYISRRQAKFRAVANEAEVEHLLGQYGFETWLPENLPSLRDQVALFAEAEAVVSAHGAGLTNMLFAPSGTTIVEMFEPEYTNHCYWNLSNSLGHKYWFLWGESVNNGRLNNDVKVPLDRLARTLDLALSH